MEDLILHIIMEMAEIKPTKSKPTKKRINNCLFRTKASRSFTADKDKYRHNSNDN